MPDKKRLTLKLENEGKEIKVPDGIKGALAWQEFVTRNIRKGNVKIDSPQILLTSE